MAEVTTMILSPSALAAAKKSSHPMESTNPEIFVDQMALVETVGETTLAEEKDATSSVEETKIKVLEEKLAGLKREKEVARLQAEKTLVQAQDFRNLQQTNMMGNTDNNSPAKPGGQETSFVDYLYNSLIRTGKNEESKEGVNENHIKNGEDDKAHHATNLMSNFLCFANRDTAVNESTKVQKLLGTENDTEKVFVCTVKDVEEGVEVSSDEVQDATESKLHCETEPDDDYDGVEVASREKEMHKETNTVLLSSGAVDDDNNEVCRRDDDYDGVKVSSKEKEMHNETIAVLQSSGRVDEDNDEVRRKEGHDEIEEHCQSITIEDKKVGDAFPPKEIKKRTPRNVASSPTAPEVLFLSAIAYDLETLVSGRDFEGNPLQNQPTKGRTLVTTAPEIEYLAAVQKDVDDFIVKKIEEQAQPTPTQKAVEAVEESFCSAFSCGTSFFADLGDGGMGCNFLKDTSPEVGQETRCAFEQPGEYKLEQVPRCSNLPTTDDEAPIAEKKNDIPEVVAVTQMFNFLISQARREDIAEHKDSELAEPRTRETDEPLEKATRKEKYTQDLEELSPVVQETQERGEEASNAIEAPTDEDTEVLPEDFLAEEATPHQDQLAKEQTEDTSKHEDAVEGNCSSIGTKDEADLVETSPNPVVTSGEPCISVEKIETTPAEDILSSDSDSPGRTPSKEDYAEETTIEFVAEGIPHYDQLSKHIVEEKLVENGIFNASFNKTSISKEQIVETIEKKGFQDTDNLTAIDFDVVGKTQTKEAKLCFEESAAQDTLHLEELANNKQMEGVIEEGLVHKNPKLEIANDQGGAEGEALKKISNLTKTGKKEYELVRSCESDAVEKGSEMSLAGNSGQNVPVLKVHGSHNAEENNKADDFSIITPNPYGSYEKKGSGKSNSIDSSDSDATRVTAFRSLMASDHGQSYSTSRKQEPEIEKICIAVDIVDGETGEVEKDELIVEEIEKPEDKAVIGKKETSSTTGPDCERKESEAPERFNSHHSDAAQERASEKALSIYDGPGVANPSEAQGLETEETSTAQQVLEERIEAKKSEPFLEQAELPKEEETVAITDTKHPGVRPKSEVLERIGLDAAAGERVFDKALASSDEQAVSTSRVPSDGSKCVDSCDSDAVRERAFDKALASEGEKAILSDGSKCVESYDSDAVRERAFDKALASEGEKAILSDSSKCVESYDSDALRERAFEKALASEGEEAILPDGSKCVESYDSDAVRERAFEKALASEGELEKSSLIVRTDGSKCVDSYDSDAVRERAFDKALASNSDKDVTTVSQIVCSYDSDAAREMAFDKALVSNDDQPGLPTSQNDKSEIEENRVSCEFLNEGTKEVKKQESLVRQIRKAKEKASALTTNPKLSDGAPECFLGNEKKESVSEHANSCYHSVNLKALVITNTKIIIANPEPHVSDEKKESEHISRSGYGDSGTKRAGSNKEQGKHSPEDMSAIIVTVSSAKSEVTEEATKSDEDAGGTVLIC